MRINRIHVTNFKSFKNLDINLSDFNIIIGSNVSGKSNFVEIFSFLKDISKHGLSNAVSMHGGIDYLKNINSYNQQMSIQIEFNADQMIMVSKNDLLYGIKIKKNIYEFSIDGDQNSQYFSISSDKLIQNIIIYKLQKEKDQIIEEENVCESELIVEKKKNKIETTLTQSEKNPIEKEYFFPSMFNDIDVDVNTLLLQTPFFLHNLPFGNIFDYLSIYVFDARRAKKAIPITGKMEFEEDGCNIAIVLKQIISDEMKKRKFSNLLQDLLPFVEDFRVEQFADKSLLFKMKEDYSEEYFPSSLLSEGTINIISIIIALYFEEKPFIIIEEPERNIHPFLISKVLKMIKEASKNKQIILTTHNPELIKHAELEDIFVVNRNEVGISQISKPSQKQEVNTFLNNEIGIEDLFIKNLLEI